MSSGALQEGIDFYRDKSGYVVFTAEYLLKRGNCCKHGCRHCPYASKGTSCSESVPMPEDPLYPQPPRRRGPRRIVCLTAETVDLLYQLGVQDRVVGVSGFTRFPPEARRKPFVSAFTTVYYDVIESLAPDLILGFSDLQADAVRELGKRGYPALLTNQRSLQEMFDALVMIGRIVDKGQEAEILVAELERRLNAAREASRSWRRRPKVYFEEWDDPIITGITWVGELIEAAGGELAFPELTSRRTASERIIQPESVVAEAPDIIIASWCGKRADLDGIRARSGWDAVPAVRSGAVHEIKSTYCLQPGPILITEGLPRFCEIIRAWQAKSDEPSRS